MRYLAIFLLSITAIGAAEPVSVETITAERNAAMAALENMMEAKAFDYLNKIKPEIIQSPELGPDPRQSERDADMIVKQHNSLIARVGELNAVRERNKKEGGGYSLYQEVMDTAHNIERSRDALAKAGITAPLAPAVPADQKAAVLAKPKPKGTIKITLADGTVVQQ